MKYLTISVIFSVQLALCDAQTVNIEVYEITATELVNVFGIRPFNNYQKLAVGDDHLIVIADSNVVFTEYDMRNGQRLFQKQLRTQLTDYVGNNILDMCYQKNGDFCIAYDNEGLIFTYKKSIQSFDLQFRSSGSIQKIRADKFWRFSYFINSYQDDRGWIRGEFDRIIVGSYDTVRNDWRPYPLAYMTDSTRLFIRTQPYGITDFDFNQKTAVFAFLNTNNELTSFHGLSKQEAKALLKKSKNGVSWEHQNKLWASQPEHLNDRKIRPAGQVKALQVVKGDSVMHVIDNGDVFVRHYDSEILSEPIFNVGDSLLRKGLIYIDELDRFIWVYPNKIVYSTVISGVMKVVTENLFEDEIIDFKISTNERKLAVVTRDMVEHAVGEPVKIEIKTTGQ